MDSFVFNSKSKLPGGLGYEVNGHLKPDEIILAEAVAARGIGLALTESRLVIVRAGLLQTGNPTERRSAAISLQHIRGLSMTDSGHEGQRLLIDSQDARCPHWARSVYVANACV